MYKCLLNLKCLITLGSVLLSFNVSANEMDTTSLYARMGGTPVMTKIVDDFVDEVATSPKTKRSFEGIKLKALKESIVQQMCKISGGGCVYEGETMLNSHRDAKITEAEFDAFVEMFRETLNRYLPTREKNELLKILAPMKRDIVAPQQ